MSPAPASAPAQGEGGLLSEEVDTCNVGNATSRSSSRSTRQQELARMTPTSARLLTTALDSLRASFPEAKAEAVVPVLVPPPPRKEDGEERTAPEATPPPVRSLSLSVPSLSLHHETRLEHRNNKKRVEEHASCLLSRPVLSSVEVVEVVVKANSREDSDEVEGAHNNSSPATTKTTETATLLMENLSESFGVLLDARLRAYATFLARHGIALAKTSALAATPLASAASTDDDEAKSRSPPPMPPLSGVLGMEEKVRSLLEMGASVRARQMELEFSVLPDEDDAPSSLNDNDKVDNEGNDADPAHPPTRHPVRMTASMQLEMTGPKGEQQGLQDVNIVADGYAHVASFLKKENVNGSGSAASCEVVVELNTRRLLDCMIHQASDVVEHVVDAANTSSILKASRLCRSSSYLAMPPPPHLPQGVPADGARSGPMVPMAMPLANPRRSESFLMLPHGNLGEDEDDNDDSAATSASSTDSNVVSPDTNAVSSSATKKANAMAGLGGRGAAATDAIPPLDLNESPPHHGDDYDFYHHHEPNDDEDDEAEYFLQDLSPEACESILDGIFGGSAGHAGGSVSSTFGGSGGSCRSACSVADDHESGTLRPAKMPRIEAPPAPGVGAMARNDAPVLVRL